MTCVAKKSSCGKFYIVNGVKKWITNGAYADYFVTAVRTGDAGMFGISMLVIEVHSYKIIFKTKFLRELKELPPNKSKLVTQRLQELPT